MEKRIIRMWSGLNVIKKGLKVRGVIFKWFIGREIFPEVKKLEMITMGGSPFYISSRKGENSIPEPGMLLGMPIKLIEGNHIILGIDE